MFRQIFSLTLALTKALSIYDTPQVSSTPLYYSFFQFVESRNNLFEVPVSFKIHKDFGKNS